MRSNSSSSSKKKRSNWNETSTFVSPPFSRCSSTVCWPPENACLFIYTHAHAINWVDRKIKDERYISIKCPLHKIKRMELIAKLQTDSATKFKCTKMSIWFSLHFCNITESVLLFFPFSFTFVLICFGVSVKNTAEFVSLADIFVLAPCNAGKNVEWMSAGLGNPRRGATSLVIRKYGSWSMAHGIKQFTFFSPNINGNVDENAGAACTAGNAIFPMGSESPKPKIPFTWLNVTHFWMRIKFW